MPSGIGPADHLRSAGVEALVDAPGIGENLQDHQEGVIMWEAKQPVVTRSTQWWEIGIFSGTEPGLDRPDLMFHYGPVPFDMNTYRYGYPTSQNDRACCLTPNVARVRSTGTVRLRARGFRGKPMVDPRHFTHEHDLRDMGYGLRLARKIASQPALSAWPVPNSPRDRTCRATRSSSTASARPTTPSTTRPAR